MPALAATTRRCTTCMDWRRRRCICRASAAALRSHACKTRVALPCRQVSSDASRQHRVSSRRSSLGAGNRLGSRRQCTQNLKPQEKLAIAPQIERVPLLQALTKGRPSLFDQPRPSTLRGPLAVVVLRVLAATIRALSPFHRQ